MDSKLLTLISDYQKIVAEKLQQLCSELNINTPKTNAEWACNGLKQRGQLSDGTLYFKHGFGCAIKYSSGTIDFDFGAKGEINGFDPSRLWEFIKTSKLNYGFSSKKEIEMAIHESVNTGEIFYSGYILYFLNDQKLQRHS